MEKIMNKPISMQVSDYRQELSNITNKYMDTLSPTIIELILVNLVNELHNLSTQQLELETREYNESLKEST